MAVHVADQERLPARILDRPPVAALRRVLNGEAEAGEGTHVNRHRTGHAQAEARRGDEDLMIILACQSCRLHSLT